MFFKFIKSYRKYMNIHISKKWQPSLEICGGKRVKSFSVLSPTIPLLGGHF